MGFKLAKKLKLLKQKKKEWHYNHFKCLEAAKSKIMNQFLQIDKLEAAPTFSIEDRDSGFDYKKNSAKNQFRRKSNRNINLETGGLQKGIIILNNSMLWPFSTVDK